MLGHHGRPSAWAVNSPTVAIRVKRRFQSQGSFQRRLVLNGLVFNILLMMLAVQASASETSLLPYIPTTILIPGSTAGVASGQGIADANSTAYIFSSADDGSVNLLSLNISSALNSSSISSSATTLTTGLPFLSSSSNTTTFTPTLAEDGSIIVYAGDCSSETGSSVWIYNTTTSSEASWVQDSVTDSAGGPSFLGGGIAYSEIISPNISQPIIYSYGGQCPNATLNGTTWISAADYSNSMVRLAPLAGSSSGMNYSVETLSIDDSQPVAEAGFSFTYLSPSTSNIAGTETQSIDSVVLGGHTRSAFVNMSTAAVWSLPEESWSFVSISGPSTSSSTDTSELAKNDEETTTVESRSGHTAVLNEDGTSLIILGGWVGNTSQAAQPQLAVLEINDGVFGEWSWSIPDEQPLDDGEGIYGHGAALLPGNVMMVAGGNAISSLSTSSSGSRLSRRDQIGVAGGQLQMFFNITSQTWSNSYTNPLSTSTGSESESTTTSLSFKDRLGLGLGLGLGIPVLFIMLAVCFFCLRRRQRANHAVRDEHVRRLTAGTAFITSDEMLEREHEHVYPWGPAGAARWYYTGGHDPYMRDEGRSLGYENLRGLHGDQSDYDDPMDSEHAGAYRRDARRKPAPRVARGLYQPTGVDGMDDGPGAIHPILEDEEDEIAMTSAISPDRDEGLDESPFMETAPETPTRTARPPGSAMLYAAPGHSNSGPPSPTETRTIARAQPQHPDVQDWVSDIDASDALITARLQPRSTIRSVGKVSPVSPTRRDSVRASDDDAAGVRTDSNLSDSNRSAFSFILNRSDSLRVAAAGAAWLGAGKSRNEHERGGTSHSDNSNSGNSGNSENTQGSYATAKSIPALRAEGPGLLLGRPRPISDIEDLGHISDNDPLTPGSPSKSKQPRRSWFGSLKRVFSGGTGSGSSNGSSSRTDSPTHGQSSDYDGLGLGSLGLGGIGLLQKRRQGKSAWGGAGPSGSGGGQGAGDNWEDEGEDWDIEKAVENRLVQVMFSVPKDRLRVVNADADLVSLEESVVVVDPERDEIQPSPASATEEAKSGKGTEPLNEKSAEGRDDVASQSEEAQNARDISKHQAKQPERQSLLLEVPQRLGRDSPEISRPRSIPPLMTPPLITPAEAHRIPRPRSRVLEMVESFEERSRSNSPDAKASSSSLSSRSSRLASRDS